MKAQFPELGTPVDRAIWAAQRAERHFQTAKNIIRDARQVGNIGVRSTMARSARNVNRVALMLLKLSRSILS